MTLRDCQQKFALVGQPNPRQGRKPLDHGVCYSPLFASFAVHIFCLLITFAFAAGCSKPTQPTLLVYSAAVAREPMEQLATQYEAEHGVRVELQFGGSNTLLGKVALSGVGDVFLAADASYLGLASDRGLAGEPLSVAVARPVLIVNRSATDHVASLDDLMTENLRVALANPETAALGRATEQVFRRLGLWGKMKQQVERHGVFTPTAPAVASAVALGGADVGVTWRVLADRYDELVVLDTSELAAERGTLAIATLTSARDPAAAKLFAAYVVNQTQGGAVFVEHGFEAVGGSPP